jgi:hypothetical protein
MSNVVLFLGSRRSLRFGFLIFLRNRFWFNFYSNYSKLKPNFGFGFFISMCEFSFSSFSCFQSMLVPGFKIGYGSSR